MKKRILFHSGQVSERGTEVALLDYALGNAAVLGNESVCLFPRSKIVSPSMNERFKSLFDVRYYDDPGEWDGIAEELGADGFYSIRAGGGSGREELPSRVPSFIHCVFDTRTPYGTVCAAISPWLNKRYRTRLPVMPHIVERKSAERGDLRERLGIDRSATVFGCYGGAFSFSVEAARRAVRRVARQRPDIFFAFMNIVPFCDMANVRFLPGSTDADEKQRFINTCDAMLHGRREGETFGLSVAEFFISGKPVFTYMPIFDPRRRYDAAHLQMLGDAAITYRSAGELERLLRNFRKTTVSAEVARSRYLEPFSSRRVLGIFDELFASKL
jgi:hypothetical protein